MNEDEIVERGAIAYCVVYCSMHTMLDIILEQEAVRKRMEAKQE